MIQYKTPVNHAMKNTMPESTTGAAAKQWVRGHAAGRLGDNRMIYGTG